MKKLIASAALIAVSFSVHAGTYSFNCSMADVSCKDLFPDLVSDKFTAKFPHDRFEIFVMASTSAFSDGSGASYAVVGVAPRSKQSHDFAPNRWWDSVTTYKNLGNAYDKQNASRENIRKAIESMMAACADSKSCEILGSK